ncbi:serine hydroxymethyltransferase [Patescibacteria group bacterium]|nr:serine hydroxymethyltransferase [Patescibacteria group bacterium]
MSSLKKTDPDVAAIIGREEERQQSTLSLIPSENFFSPAVREAVGSVMSHKYSEGNIGKRYYEGNEQVDELESLAIARAKEVFMLPADWEVNVQALSGSNANLAVYLALLKRDDMLMGMYLPDGGHLSHGWSFEPDPEIRSADVASGRMVYLGGSRKVNITSRMFKVVQYKTDPKTRIFNYNEIAKIAAEYKPRMLITGGTAYPRNIDYVRIKEIAKKVGAFYLADIAHEAGLVAAAVVPSPIGIADVVTMTTHKTLRAGRGAIIFSSAELMKKINRAILPGLQGGPHNHNLAGICVGLGEAAQPSFRRYAQTVVANAQRLAGELWKHDFELVAGGTDKHLVLIDLHTKPLLGRSFARALAAAGIVTNANSVPQEIRGPADPSGLRLGTPWVTTQGMGQPEMTKIAAWMNEVMAVAAQWSELPAAEFDDQLAQSPELKRIAMEVRVLCEKYPLPFTAEVRAEATSE